jgi:hypothetical protein
VYAVGSSGDKLKLWLQLSIVPGWTHLCAWEGASIIAFASSAVAHGVASAILVYTIRRGIILAIKFPP